MSSIRDTRNIVGNVDQLEAYKKEISYSTEKLILYWGWFITGIWITEQTKDFNFIFKDFMFGYLPGIILWSYLVYRWIRNMNTIYTSDKTIREKIGLSSSKKTIELKFSDYIKNFHINHPLLTLCIVGLLINQIYFMEQYERILNLLGQIPLVGSFYEERFSIILLIILFIIGNYLDFIKTDLIRYPLKIFVYIHLPVIIAGELLGFCSIFIYPIVSIFTNVKIIIDFKYWIANDINFVVMLIVPMILIVLYRLTTIRELDEEINKFNDGNRGEIINENT